MKTITDFEIINHGIEGEQYFQGCGVAFSKFKNVVTGIGNTEKDALVDAMEQIDESEFGGMPNEIVVAMVNANDKDTVQSSLNLTDEEAEDCSSYFYVSIRWN